jgi:hypothetical protein
MSMMKTEFRYLLSGVNNENGKVAFEWKEVSTISRHCAQWRPLHHTDYM